MYPVGTGRRSRLHVEGQNPEADRRYTEDKSDPSGPLVHPLPRVPRHRFRLALCGRTRPNDAVDGLYEPEAHQRDTCVRVRLGGAVLSARGGGVSDHFEVAERDRPAGEGECQTDNLWITK